MAEAKKSTKSRCWKKYHQASARDCSVAHISTQLQYTKRVGYYCYYMDFGRNTDSHFWLCVNVSVRRFPLFATTAFKAIELESI